MEVNNTNLITDMYLAGYREVSSEQFSKESFGKRHTYAVNVAQHFISDETARTYTKEFPEEFLIEKVHNLLDNCDYYNEIMGSLLYRSGWPGLANIVIPKECELVVKQTTPITFNFKDHKIFCFRKAGMLFELVSPTEALDILEKQLKRYQEMEKSYLNGRDKSQYPKGFQRKYEIVQGDINGMDANDRLLFEMRMEGLI